LAEFFYDVIIDKSIPCYFKRILVKFLCDEPTGFVRVKEHVEVGPEIDWSFMEA
jgi:hypothetical protein